MAEKYRHGEYGYDDHQHANGSSRGGVLHTGDRPAGYDDEDPFGHEEGHDVGILSPS